MRIPNLFFFIFFMMTSSLCMAEGIDSEGTELPLNAKGVRVATLRSTGTANSGVLDIDGALNAKKTISSEGLIIASSGVKVGDIANGVCGNAEYADGGAGLIRYNSGKLEYCNGSVWLAASGGGGGSYRTVCECRCGDRFCSCNCTPPNCDPRDTQIRDAQCSVAAGQDNFLKYYSCERWCLHSQ